MGKYECKTEWVSVSKKNSNNTEWGKGKAAQVFPVYAREYKLIFVGLNAGEKLGLVFYGKLTSDNSWLLGSSEPRWPTKRVRKKRLSTILKVHIAIAIIQRP